MARTTAKIALTIIVVFLLSFAILAETTRGIGFLENIELPGLFNFGAKKTQVFVFKVPRVAQNLRHVYKIDQRVQLNKTQRKEQIKNEIDRIKESLRQEQRIIQLKTQRKEQIKNEIDKIREALRKEQQTDKVCQERIFQIKQKLIAETQNETSEAIEADNLNLYMGIGSYGFNAYDLAGDFVWAKIRYRPFHFYDDKLELGFFGFGAFGIGSNKDSYHTVAKFAVGPSLKFNFFDWTADLDFGVGKLSNEINGGNYMTKQIDDLFVFSGYFDVHSRRNEKKRWLPKASFGFEANLPYSTNYKGCLREYNNKVISLWFKQAIYDFEPTQNLLLTPELNIGLKREYEEKSNFLRVGPSLTMSYDGQDILSLSFLNYEKAIGKGQDEVKWLSGWLSIGGIIRALKASRIKMATDKDLEARVARVSH